ncbi:nucleotidyltransferase domain-containing protein [Neisseria leonii]|uniref:Nucleotidyltransferase domain-containing protein n=1 Tax=Neisseria leonii TaxID=2995413 RepID=A0A9X4I9Y7_9NEIS|nr:nucleotidyltransferase domain-containing protein [Neisseria sp. 51.81]MDD9326829.1 nucleotidyltransferase domain-containing protein [Neisseria sp. 51.81]
MDKLDITPQEREIVCRILRKNVPQHAVWAFGFRVNGTARMYSDLDLAVIGNRPLPLAVHAALKDDFSQSDLPWKVDIVDWGVIGPEFRNIILRQYRVFQEAV